MKDADKSECVRGSSAVCKCNVFAAEPGKCHRGEILQRVPSPLVAQHSPVILAGLCSGLPAGIIRGT